MMSLGMARMHAMVEVMKVVRTRVMVDLVSMSPYGNLKASPPASFAFLEHLQTNLLERLESKRPMSRI